jgi:hypothetical protein
MTGQFSESHLAELQRQKAAFVSARTAGWSIHQRLPAVGLGTGSSGVRPPWPGPPTREAVVSRCAMISGGLGRSRRRPAGELSRWSASTRAGVTVERHGVGSARRANRGRGRGNADATRSGGSGSGLKSLPSGGLATVAPTAAEDADACVARALARGRLFDPALAGSPHGWAKLRRLGVESFLGRPLAAGRYRLTGNDVGSWRASRACWPRGRRGFPRSTGRLRSSSGPPHTTLIEALSGTCSPCAASRGWRPGDDLARGARRGARLRSPASAKRRAGAARPLAIERKLRAAPLQAGAAAPRWACSRARGCCGGCSEPLDRRARRRAADPANEVRVAEGLSAIRVGRPVIR